MTPVLEIESVYAEPRKTHEWWRDTLPTVPDTQAWNDAIRLVARLDEGISLVVLRGRPSEDLVIPSPGTSVFGIQILLRGRPSIALAHGPLTLPAAGSLLLFRYAEHVGSKTRLAAGDDVHIVDIRYTMQALARATSFPVAAHLENRFFGETQTRQSGVLVSFAANKSILSLAASLERTPFPEGPARALWQRAKAQEILAHVVGTLSVSTQSAALHLSMREHAALDKAVGILEESYEKDWTVGALRQVVHLSEKKLQAGLKARTGMSVHAFLRQLRLQAAATQIAHGVQVTQAAMAVGYGNMSHFSKAFRDQFGVPPKAYKRERGNDARGVTRRAV